ncbi:uncharacterized protein K02A2.6-like [Aedes albopictus]|uniref:RNA-directed DNA polymerase n=1 Tax=Aedes albopictus TaxID=7160 RepID=A0ABM1XK90_AEDAL
MKALARSHVYWPKIDDSISDYVKQCDKCATHSKTLPKVPLQSWPLAQSPWERIHIDFAGPVNGLHFLVVIDAFSKWPEISIVRSPTTAAVINFLDEVFARFGVPITIVSDNGTQFSSVQFAEFCKKNGIQHLRISPYHPQSNGQAERFVETLKTALLKINEGEKISESLQIFLQAYRTTPSRTLNGKTPSQLMIGRNMRTVLSLLQPRQPMTSIINQRQNDQFNRKHGVVPRNLQAGDAVYANVYQSNSKWKWASGVIIEVIGQVNFNILLDEWHGRRKLIRSHANQIKHRFDDQQPTKEPTEKSSLNIFVDEFGLQDNFQQNEVTTVAPTEPAPDQEVFIDATDDDEALPEMEVSLPESIQHPQPDEEASTSRPRRMIQMPSRLEPFLVFWK